MATPGDSSSISDALSTIAGALSFSPSLYATIFQQVQTGNLQSVFHFQHLQWQLQASILKSKSSWLTASCKIIHYHFVRIASRSNGAVQMTTSCIT